MSNGNSHHKLLLKFEHDRRQNNDSVADFTHTQRIDDSMLVIELIALDMEIRMSLGEQFDTEDYFFDFPHLVHQIPKIYAQVLKDFKRNFCPVTSRFGPLPTDIHGHRVSRELARGGMGVVYLAEQADSQTPCALKMPFFKSDSNEASILAKVEHPNVCRLLGSGSTDGFAYVCTELVAGKTVKEILSGRDRFTAIEAVKIVRQIACGLHSIHSSGCVHFDINPGNIMIADSGKPTLIDFGLAMSIENSNLQELGGGGCAFGTPDYASPEMFDEAYGTPGPASDVYGLGVLLYEMLTGTRPFSIKQQQDIQVALRSPPSRLSDYEGLEIDANLEDICLNTLAKCASDRTSSMKELAIQLDDWLTVALINEWLA